MTKSFGLKFLLGLGLCVVLAGRLAAMTGIDADRVERILVTNCAACHGGKNPKAGVRLEKGEWFAAMVNVAAREKPELKIVDPRQPENSYLLRKITGQGIEGGRMPLGDEPLSGADEQSSAPGS